MTPILLIACTAVNLVWPQARPIAPELVVKAEIALSPTNGFPATLSDLKLKADEHFIKGANEVVLKIDAKNPLARDADALEQYLRRIEAVLQSAEKENAGCDELRLKRGKETIFFVVNFGNAAREAFFAPDALQRGKRHVVIADPWTGRQRLAKVTPKGVELKLEPRESAFIVCSPGVSLPPPERPDEPDKIEICSEWKYRELDGALSYSTEISLVETPLFRQMNLGTLTGSARVKINGKKIGVVIQPPYSLEIPRKILRIGKNKIEIEITCTQPKQKNEAFGPVSLE